MIYRHPFLAHAAFFHGFFPGLLLAAFLFQIVLVVVPAFMILKRMGFSGWWALITYLPFGRTIGLWVLATTPWPVEQGARRTPGSI